MENKNILEIKKKDGMKYSIRKDRHRYFFPDEWEDFIKQVSNEKHKLLFYTLLNTGARIMEALHIRPEDFNWNRKTISIKVVKARVAKKRSYSLGKTRTFFIGENYLKMIKSYVRRNSINESQYLFLKNSKLPEDYDNLNNKDKQKYFNSEKHSYSRMFKNKLQKAEIKDYQDFSLHNIRKTYGNWMRVHDIELVEICFRMGHDIDTFMQHYGSTLLFDSSEKRKIMKILGDVK